MPSKKSLKITLIVLSAIFILSLILPFIVLANQRAISFSEILSSLNWPIFIILLTLIIITLILYLKAKE